MLDKGRAAFLRAQGFEVRLCTYVDRRTSTDERHIPENVLVASTREGVALRVAARN